jgi:hypothetical protein
MFLVESVLQYKSHSPASRAYVVTCLPHYSSTVYVNKSVRGIYLVTTYYIKVFEFHRYRSFEFETVAPCFMLRPQARASNQISCGDSVCMFVFFSF